MSRRDCLQAARLFRAELLAVLVAALLSACGGGQDSPSDAAAMPPLQQTLLENQACSPQAILEGMAQPIGQDCVRSLPLLRTQARPRALAVTTASASAAVSASSLTPDMLMDWAERQYPELFAPAASPTQSASPYLYRHYASTGNYLAVAGTEIYVLGPVSGGQLSRVGTLADFSCVVANIGCAVPGAPSIVQITPGDRSASIQFGAPGSAGSSPVIQYSASCASGTEPTITALGNSSPITVSGLTNSKKYSCVVTASNKHGTGAPSASASVIPVPPLPSYKATTIKLVSDAGDYIGAGKIYEYNKSNSNITVEASGKSLAIRVAGDENWSAGFELPATQKTWTPGTYDGANGGLSWTGEGRACGSTKGSITVTAASYTDGALDSISLSFVQNCDGRSAALRGTIVWGANDPTQPAGAVTPVPASLWKAAASATPASGGYVYLQSDAGDYIGAGKTYLYTGSPAPQVSGDSSKLSIAVGGWNGTFVPMQNTALQAGYYPDLIRYPFHNPAKGGLSWDGNGRGCNKLSGWFAIDDIAYADKQLQRITLRFTQYCDGKSSPLRGQIVWSRP